MFERRSAALLGALVSWPSVPSRFRYTIPQLCVAIFMRVISRVSSIATCSLACVSRSLTSMAAAAVPPLRLKDMTLFKEQGYIDGQWCDAGAGGTMPVFDPASGDAVDAAIYRRLDLEPGQTFEGPAILTEDETSTVVPPNFKAMLNALGEIELLRKES